MTLIETRMGIDNKAPGTPHSQVQKINETKIIERTLRPKLLSRRDFRRAWLKRAAGSAPNFCLAEDDSSCARFYFHCKIELRNQIRAVSLKENKTSFGGEPDDSSCPTFAAGAVRALDEIPKDHDLLFLISFHDMKLSR
jgi:hypothetical protein